MSVHNTNIRTAYRVITWEKGRGVIEDKQRDKQRVEYTSRPGIYSIRS